MLECLIVAGVAIFVTAIAATLLNAASAGHYRERLTDKADELKRAYARIDVLEQMLDESRASILQVQAPERRSVPPAIAPLPFEVLAELDQIDDPTARAEMEADIRIQMDASPGVDPLIIAAKVIGGE